MGSAIEEFPHDTDLTKEDNVDVANNKRIGSAGITENNGAMICLGICEHKSVFLIRYSRFIGAKWALGSSYF